MELLRYRDINHNTHIVRMREFPYVVYYIGWYNTQNARILPTYSQVKDISPPIFYQHIKTGIWHSFIHTIVDKVLLNILMV